MKTLKTQPRKIISIQNSQWPYEKNIGIETKFQHSFILKKESSIDRFFKFIGFSKEFTTNDNNFDAQIYITCDDNNFHNFLKNNKIARDIILELMSLGANSITHTQNDLVIVCNQKAYKKNNLKEDIHKNRIIELLNNFEDLLENNVPPNKKKYSTLLTISITSFIISSMILFILIMKDINTLASSGLFYDTIIFTSPITLIFCLYRCINSFKTSYAHRVLVASIIMLFMMPVLLYPLAVAINIYFDDSTGIKHHVYIKNKNLKRRGSSPSLYFKSCNRTGYAFSLYTNDKLFNILNPGDTAIAVMKQGRLGYPWGYSISHLTNGSNCPKRENTEK